jgi:hypothetical protein
MAEFDVEDVTRIAREAAREQTPTVKVAGVVLGAGGSDYIEILVNLEGCRAEPCQFSLGVFRNVSEAALEDCCRGTVTVASESPSRWAGCNRLRTTLQMARGHSRLCASCK